MSRWHDLGRHVLPARHVRCEWALVVDNGKTKTSLSRSSRTNDPKSPANAIWRPYGHLMKYGHYPTCNTYLIVAYHKPCTIPFLRFAFFIIVLSIGVSLSSSSHLCHHLIAPCHQNPKRFPQKQSVTPSRGYPAKGALSAMGKALWAGYHRSKGEVVAPIYGLYAGTCVWLWQTKIYDIKGMSRFYWEA